jgi:hypothetical protein
MYQAGDHYIFSRNDSDPISHQAPYETVYAIWSPDHRVSYTGGGATLGFVPIDYFWHPKDSRVFILPPGTLSWSGHIFTGWKNSVDSEVYLPFQTFRITQDTTLTAQWTRYTPPDPPTPTDPNLPTPPPEPPTIPPPSIPDPPPPSAPNPTPEPPPVTPTPPKAITKPTPIPESSVEKSARPPVILAVTDDPAASAKPDGDFKSNIMPDGISYGATSTTILKPLGADMSSKEALLDAGRDLGIPIFGINSNEVPLFAPDGFDTWSLSDMILAILSALFAGSALLTARKSRMRDENLLEGDDFYEAIAKKIALDDLLGLRRPFIALSSVLGAVAILLFFLLENMRRPMVLFDEGIILYAAIFIAVLLLTKFPRR